MKYQPQNENLSELVRGAESGKILLPNFQRGFEWKHSEQAGVAASVLLGIPAGSLLMIREASSQFSAKRLGAVHALDSHAGVDGRFLLDGQQRLSSLRQIFGDPYAQPWLQTHKATYQNLQYRWTLRLRRKEKPTNESGHESSTPENRFGVDTLEFVKPPFDSEVVADWLDYHRILTRGHKKDPPWFHPDFAQSETTGPSERSNQIAQAAANENSIPLWGVISAEGEDPARATLLAIDKIAHRTFEKLKDQLQDDTIDPELHEQLKREVRERQGVPGDPSVAELEQALLKRESKWYTDMEAFIKGVGEFTFPVINLGKGKLSDAVVIFEAINRGGKPLTTFDLISARYARGGADQKSLAETIVEQIRTRDDVLRDGPKGEYQRPSGVMLKENDELTPQFQTFFHQGLTLKAKLEQMETDSQARLSVEDVKKGAALSLSVESIKGHAEQVTRAIYASWRFLQVQCSVPSESRLRNKMLMVPLMVIYLKGNGEIPELAERKLQYWFWVSTLTAQYTREQDRRSIEDARLLMEWIYETPDINPFAHLSKLVMASPGYSDIETLLGENADELGAKADEYINMFVNSQSGLDILENTPLRVWETPLEVHHIVPLGSVTELKQTSSALRKMSNQSAPKKTQEFAKLLNSPLNLCFVSKESNRTIGAMNAERYLRNVERRVFTGLCIPHDLESYNPATEDDKSWVRKFLVERHEKILEKWHTFETTFER